MSATYNARATLQALHRLKHSPLSLDETDLGQLTLCHLQYAARDAMKAAQLTLLSKATGVHTATAAVDATIATVPPGEKLTVERLGLLTVDAITRAFRPLKTALVEQQARTALLTDRVLELEAQIATTKEPVT